LSGTHWLSGLTYFHRPANRVFQILVRPDDRVRQGKPFLVLVTANADRMQNRSAMMIWGNSLQACIAIFHGTTASCRIGGPGSGDDRL